MNNPSQKQANHQRKTKIKQWIITLAIILALISSIFLLTYWWKAAQNVSKLRKKEQTLAQLEQQKQKSASEQYELQKKQLPQVRTLSQNPAIHQFFNDFLQGYAYRFAKKQNLTDYCLPLNFGGFYQDEVPGTSLEVQARKLGAAAFNPANQQATIYLNQCYLFNQLGHDLYFATPEFYLKIDFATMLETAAHELAHYIQFVKYGKSSCQSDLGTNNYIPWLAQEQQEFTREIYWMIINSFEYQKFKKWWKND